MMMETGRATGEGLHGRRVKSHAFTWWKALRFGEGPLNREGYSVPESGRNMWRFLLISWRRLPPAVVVRGRRDPMPLNLSRPRG